MPVRSIVAAMIVAFSLQFAGPTAACEGKRTIFEDHFADDANGWQAGFYWTVADGMLNITLGPDRNAWIVINGGFEFKEADVCLDLIFPSSGAENLPNMGLNFWMTGNNMMSVTISQEGRLVATRFLNGEWATIVNQEVANINRQPGAMNRLRVVVKEAGIDVYVNGAKAKTFRVQSPGKECRFGIVAGRFKKGTPQVYRVKSIKVTSVD